jgi:two-component system, NarL family, nitrate/nitrite response regulator NarL
MEQNAIRRRWATRSHSKEPVNLPSLIGNGVRILVADDHEVMRLGIRNLLEAVPKWSVCAEASNGQEAIERAIACEPDIVIMDITMPVMNGLEAAKVISRSRPDIPVILFSLHLSDEMISSLDRAAIRGAVCKGDAARDLVEAVNRVLRGETFFPQKTAYS